MLLCGDGFFSNLLLLYMRHAARESSSFSGSRASPYRIFDKTLPLHKCRQALFESSACLIANVQKNNHTAANRSCVAKSGITPEKSTPLRVLGILSIFLDLRAGSYQSLSSLVALILRKVLDEASSQILCLVLPLGSVSIGDAGIQDSRIRCV